MSSGEWLDLANRYNAVGNRVSSVYNTIDDVKDKVSTTKTYTDVCTFNYVPISTVDNVDKMETFLTDLDSIYNMLMTLKTACDGKYRYCMDQYYAALAREAEERKTEKI